MTRKRPPTEDPDEQERKERVIHTRVPESLEAELRKRAQDLGISVSNLVRNVLGHAFGLVGDVVADSHAIARAARGETSRDSRPKADADPDDVIAWQPIVLAKNAVCSRCNDLLPRGREAAIAVGGDRAIVCTPCLEELRK
ncbi:MAG: hypothetical protein HOV81_01665 [Kofleriaceae bacterium]|nr:hypothetical protein [Kofleriaceae bacterium]